MVGHAYPSALTCSWLVLVLRHEVAVTMIICHVGWEVASDVVHRPMGGVDEDVLTTAEGRRRSEVRR
jgi:hypothetical protein